MSTPGARPVASGCPAATKRGEPCRAPLLPGGAYCAFHDPALAEERRAARTRGAIASNKLRALAGRRAKLDTSAGLVRFVATVVHDTIEGTITPDCARAVFYGLALQRQLLEKADLERRMAAIEQLQGRQWRA